MKKNQIIEKKGRETGQKRLELALFLQQEEEQDFSVSVFTFFHFFFFMKCHCKKSKQAKENCTNDGLHWDNVGLQPKGDL